METKEQRSVSQLMEILKTSKIECDKPKCDLKGSQVICYTNTYQHCDLYKKLEARR